MNLQCTLEAASGYRAGSQIARVLSEAWCTRELYCPACESNRISPSRTNTPAVDFTCPQCREPFQLKSLKNWGTKKIVDAAYNSMIRAIRTENTPNLLLLNYSSGWLIQNLLLIPRFFLVETVIEKRTPLGPQARRAGWVGCNILLSRIPDDGRIPMVAAGVPALEQHVRREYSRIRKLGEIPPIVRGWTIDVLNMVRDLKKSSFSLQELYKAEPALKAAHPHNRNIRPKIRQQLQVLRDMGLVEFVRPGNYRLRT